MSKRMKKLLVIDLLINVIFPHRLFSVQFCNYSLLHCKKYERNQKTTNYLRLKIIRESRDKTFVAESFPIIMNMSH